VILLIDNFDSFTYILFQYLMEWDQVKVIKNNEELPDLALLSSVVISPGPGLPKTSGLLMSYLQKIIGKIPVLGVCLGHQAIAEYYGAKLEKTPDIFHGRVSEIIHKNQGVFHSVPNQFLANRYHSWVVSPDQFPSELEVTARTKDGLIMGIESKSDPHVYGIQFHPESILTEHGKTLLKTFCEKRI